MEDLYPPTKFDDVVCLDWDGYEEVFTLDGRPFNHCNVPRMLMSDTVARRRGMTPGVGDAIYLFGKVWAVWGITRLCINQNDILEDRGLYFIIKPYDIEDTETLDFLRTYHAALTHWHEEKIRPLINTLIKMGKNDIEIQLLQRGRPRKKAKKPARKRVSGAFIQPV